jgi:large subunit ribosomal protein L16
MLAPKRQKHRKQFRGIYRRLAIKGEKLNFGSYGIKSLDQGMIKDRQIESCRVVLARATRKVGKYWIRIFPDKPYTKKPPEVTMGAGKGDVSHFVSPVVPGRVLFEIDGVSEDQAKQILKKVSSKLSVTTKFVTKHI